MFGWKGRFSPWPEDNKATRAEGVRTGRFFSGHREAAQVLTPSSTVPCWWRTGRVNWLAGSIALARRIANLQDAALARASLLFGMDTAALPVWDEEDEAEQSDPRPYRYSERQVLGRKRTHFIHRPARDIFSARSGNFISTSTDNPAVPSGRGSLLHRPAELRAVDPDAVHDHGKPARQRYDRPLQPAPLGNLHGPSPQP